MCYEPDSVHVINLTQYFSLPSGSYIIHKLLERCCLELLAVWITQSLSGVIERSPALYFPQHTRVHTYIEYTVMSPQGIDLHYKILTSVCCEDADHFTSLTNTTHILLHLSLSSLSF